MRNEDADIAEISEAERAQASLIRLTLEPHEIDWMQVSDGVLDIPLSVVRKLVDWSRRYDARPRATGASRPAFIDRTPR